MHLQERYAARSIRFLELWRCRGWRMKLYGLAYGGEVPEPVLVEAAKALASTCLPQPAVTIHRYGVGFMGVHQGRGSNLVFVDWWANENELYHNAFTSPADDSISLAHAAPSGLTACVWDLAVIGFERQAWVEGVLSAPEPDVQRYLEARFEGRV